MLGALAALALVSMLSFPVATSAADFGAVVDSVSAAKNTKLAVKENWRNLKGQEVSWSGQVVEVKGGSSRAKIWVANKARPLHKGYNVVLATHDVGKAATLKKGQTIRFKGTLDDYNDFRGGAILYVSGVTL